MAKTYDDIKTDLSDVFDQVRAGDCDLKTAGELSNIAGKILKAYQLELAREIFEEGKGGGQQARLAHAA